MNIEFNKENRFSSISEKLCVPINDSLFKIKEEIGKGEIKTFKPHDDLSVFIFEFVLKEPMVAKWNFNSLSKREFILFVNVSENISNEHLDNNGIERGSTMFNPNDGRRKIWVPNVSYKVFGLSFQLDWLNKINELIKFPKNIIEFLNNNKEIYFNSFTSSTIRLVVNQIINHKVVRNDISNTFIEIKSLELVYSLLNEVFKNISIEKKGSAIHPDDFLKLNHFINTLNTGLDSLPTIYEASESLDISESKFQRLFKKITLKTYYSYVLELKMDYAMELLMDNWSVSEVAFKTGYSSISNFTIAFKRYYKMLPSEI